MGATKLGFSDAEAGSERKAPAPSSNLAPLSLTLARANLRQLSFSSVEANTILGMALGLDGDDAGSLSEALADKATPVSRDALQTAIGQFLVNENSTMNETTSLDGMSDHTSTRGAISPLSLAEDRKASWQWFFRVGAGIVGVLVVWGGLSALFRQVPPDPARDKALPTVADGGQKSAAAAAEPGKVSASKERKELRRPEMQVLVIRRPLSEPMNVPIKSAGKAFSLSAVADAAVRMDGKKGARRWQPGPGSKKAIQLHFPAWAQGKIKTFDNCTRLFQQALKHQPRLALASRKAKTGAAIPWNIRIEGVGYYSDVNTSDRQKNGVFKFLKDFKCSRELSR